MRSNYKTDLAFIEKPGINKEALKKGIFSITMRLKKSFKKRAIQVEVIKNHIYTDVVFEDFVCGLFKSEITKKSKPNVPEIKVKIVFVKILQ